MPRHWAHGSKVTADLSPDEHHWADGALVSGASSYTMNSKLRLYWWGESLSFERLDCVLRIANQPMSPWATSRGRSQGRIKWTRGPGQSRDREAP